MLSGEEKSLDPLSSVCPEILYRKTINSHRKSVTETTSLVEEQQQRQQTRATQYI